jgi:hypothetical protein
LNRCKQCSLRLIKIIFMKTGAIRCPKWLLLEDDLTIHAWNRWPLATLERWPLKRVKLYSNISWAGLKVTVRQRWPVRQVINCETANGHLFHAWIVRSSSNNGHFGHLIKWHNVYDRSRDMVTFKIINNRRREIQLIELVI